MRFEKFQYLLGVVLSRSILKPETALSAAAKVYNPNVRTNIEQDTSVPVEQKVQEYFRFITGAGPKPFWFNTGE